MPSITQIFQQSGGFFLVKEEEFARKLRGIRAFLFDWDGVFNMGEKGQGYVNGFTEADAMGLNLLRFGFWIMNTGTLPHTGIITGMLNESPKFLADREHLDCVYAGFKHKNEAFEDFCQRYELKPHEVAWVYDDVIDLSIARRCGLRILVRRDASPMFEEFVMQSALADYATGSPGGFHAVREFCELCLASWGNYFEVVKDRMEFSSRYQEYLRLRNAVQTDLFEKN